MHPSKRGFSCLMALVLLISVPAFAESHTTTLAPDSGQDGYEGEFTFASGLRNCYGEVSAAFGSPQFRPTVYHYRGKSYSPQDLGMDSFQPRKPGAEIEADLYDGEQNLGHRQSFCDHHFQIRFKTRADLVPARLKKQQCDTDAAKHNGNFLPKFTMHTPPRFNSESKKTETNHVRQPASLHPATASSWCFYR